MSEKKGSLDPLSLERIVPEALTSGEATGEETLRLHLERYKFASNYLIEGNLLDVACGVGYGTAILAGNKDVTDATGVDIDPAAIEYARLHYSKGNIRFLCADASQIAAESKFANIVSLETIEHVDDPRSFFSHLVSLLLPGGRLIGSVPVTPSVDANPHHKTNFSRSSFERMGSRNGLVALTSMLQLQPFNPVSVGARRETRAKNLRRNLTLFYLRHPSHLGLRMWSTIRDGFVNKYVTIVWQKR